MKIIIAPDSFKGSLTAAQAADAMAAGVRRAFPGAEIVAIPLADGGEGTVDAWLRADATRRRCTASVSGPFGDRVEAAFGVSDSTATAVVESASACGLMLVPAALRNPLNTTTYGVGELIALALRETVLPHPNRTLENDRDFGRTSRTVERLVIGLGGTATNDGGAGALQALGVRFYGRFGSVIEHRLTGGRLREIASLDASDAVRPPTEVVLASDVTNPLTGPNGASLVYGPQKGATLEIAAYLDDALGHLGALYETYLGRSVSDVAGAGAAGGLGGALLAFFGAETRSGIDLILDESGFDAALPGAALVITGEGSIDQQTLSGKTIAGVLSRCRPYPRLYVIAIGGAVDEVAAAALRSHGLFSAVAASQAGVPQQEAISRAAELVQIAVETAVREAVAAHLPPQ